MLQNICTVNVQLFYIRSIQLAGSSVPCCHTLLVLGEKSVHLT